MNIQAIKNINLISKNIFTYLKIIFLILMSIICINTLVSCQSGKATLSEEVNSDVAMANVTSIDGNKLNLNIMPMMDGNSEMQQPNGNMNNNGGGFGSAEGTNTPPAKPDDDKNQQNSSNNATPPDKPDNQNSNNNYSDSSSKDHQNNTGQKNSNGSNSDTNNQQGSTQGGKDNNELPGSGNGGQQPPDNGAQNPPDNNMNGAEVPGGPTNMNNLGGMKNNQNIILTINDESIIKNSKNEQASLSDIKTSTSLKLSISDKRNVTEIIISDNAGGMMKPDGEQNSNGNINNGTSKVTYTENTSIENQNYESNTSDENSVRVENSAEANLSNCTYNKTGNSSSNENSDFYGLNAVVYVWNQAKAILKGGTIESSAKGANGLFVYGSDSTADVSDMQISASQDNSGGIEVSGGGTICANNLNVETKGGSSAAIRSDRGGGTENVNGGSYKTSGDGSPAIYSTANVNVSNAYLESQTSEVNVIEGKNSISLNNCNLNCNVQGKNHRGDNIRNVMLYQSMSGDADQGTCNYSAKDCTYSAEHGNVFYVTNTSAIINLENSIFNGAYEAFMKVAGNSDGWGNTGKNGGDATLNCSNQKIKGNINVDNVSNLKINLKNGSIFDGSINSDGSQGNIEIDIDESSSITLTQDCYISSISGDTNKVNLNGHKLFVNGEEWSD